MITDPVASNMNKSSDLTSAAAAAGVSVFGVATGLSYDVLLAGFAGGLVSLSFIHPQGIWGRIWTLTTATILAGYSAPVAAMWISSLSSSGAELPAVAAGFFSGLFGQAVIPALSYRLRRVIAGPTYPHGEKNQ